MDILHIDPDRARADARAGRTEKEWREAEAEEIGLTHRVDALERKFTEAFPGGDWAGHCRYHEIQIELLLERRTLRAAVTEKTISGLIWAALVATGLAVWQYIKTQLK